MKFHKKYKKRSPGVALLLVLGSLTILSAVVVEFAYKSNVTYHLAMNQMDRTQAYYLAQSGISFSKLVLKFEKEARKVAKDASKKLKKTIVVPPLYEMIPINTAMIRALAGIGEEDAGEELDAEEEPLEGGDEAVQRSLNLIDLKGAESFLAFKGDFSAEIQEEDNKLNLNAFYNLNPKDKRYDRLKATLYHLLATEEFSGFFEDRLRGAQDMAQRIVDYIDRDDVFNEAGGQERGRERVDGFPDVKMKNGKLLSIEELIKVPGIGEDVFQTLKHYVTVYGADEKVNLCRSEDPLVKAVVLAYTDTNPKVEPITDDNTELLDKVTEMVEASCPEINEIGKNIDPLLAVTEEEEGTSQTTASGKTPKGSSKKKPTGEAFEDMVKEESTLFTVISSGTVGESEVKLKVVLDTSAGNPRSWRELYWRVE